MKLTRDIFLKNELWDNADELFINDSLFTRKIDYFILAASIGIREDKVLDNNKGSNDTGTSIGRNTLDSNRNDVSEYIYFLFQNAILNTKHTSLSNEIRLKLAFDPDFPDEKQKKEFQINFSIETFLVPFANYGLKKMIEVFPNSELSSIDKLQKLIEEGIEKDYSDLANELDEEILKFDKII